MDDLRRDDGSPDPWKIVDEFWPYDGPHGDWTTEAAASTIAQLVRYLNNATFYGHALPHAPGLYRVASSLSSAAFGMEQLAQQLAAQAERFAGDETLYDDRGAAHGPSATAEGLAVALAAAGPASVELAKMLQAAAGIASHLGHDSSRQ